MSPKLAEAMRASKLDTAPYLYAHRDGSAGDISTGEEMLANIGNVLRSQGARSRHVTEHGVLRIETRSGETFLSFEDES